MKREMPEFLKEFLFARSLRLRLFVILLIMGIVPGILMRHGIVENYEERAVEQRVATVQNQLMIVANHLISNNYLTNYGNQNMQSMASGEVIEAELEMLSNLYEGRVIIIGSNFKVIKDTYGISEGKILISEAVVKCFKGQNTSRYNPEHGYIEMTTPIISATNRSAEGGSDSSSVVQGVMLTSISNEAIVSTMEVLNRKAVILEALMVIVIAAVAFITANLIAQPLNRVTEAVKMARAGHTDESIEVAGYSETVQIVNSFNEVLAQMRSLDDTRQEFVANVSHELKTPMASLKVLADSLLTQDNLPVEIYREFMEDMVSEIDRENQIITDLLALVKMDKKEQNLSIVFLNMNDLVELILKRLRPLARKKDIEVIFESDRRVMAEVDEVKMSLVVSNLVENAIKYNKEHGWVKVILNADHQFFTLEVCDSGLGIPEEALAHIYERFYRVDKSHSREIGGTGLGLAITKKAILLHKGSITVTSREEEGTSFLVKVPLSYIAG